MSLFTWVTNDAPRDRDCAKVHATGCNHLAKIDTRCQVPLQAATLDEAMAEAARDEMDSDPGFTSPEEVVTAMPCARKVAAR